MRRRLTLPALVAALALALAGCGGSGDGGGSDDGAAATPTTTATATAPATPPAGELRGGLVEPPQPAPPLRLRDAEGRMVDAADFRGRPLLVTFVYANCPDVCPLLMSTIAQARRDLGPEADDLAVLAVSLDPEGDTPAAATAFLERHRMTGAARFLVGERAELERVWAAWGIEAEALHTHPPGTPADHAHDDDGSALAGANPTAGDIAHTSLTYGVSASGTLTTAYPAGFPVDAMAHDIPLLAAS